jgi:uncharacterized RDD family membrane protein YckC
MRFSNRITLSTPESVELEFTLAGIGSRTLALVVDYLLLTALLIGFWVIWGIVLAGSLSTFVGQNRDGAVGNWLLAIAILGTFAIHSGYFVGFETAWRGQTPGKRVAKIRVIRDNGQPIGLAQASLRSLLRTVDDFFFIGVFLILLGNKEKRIGDYAAGTLVIREERGDRSKTLTISDVAKDLAQKLPQLANLRQLNPDDFAVVREYLQRRSQMTPKAKSELSMRLANELRTLVALDKIPPNTTADQFLEATYLAYQQLFGDNTPR